MFNFVVTLCFVLIFYYILIFLLLCVVLYILLFCFSVIAFSSTISFSVLCRTWHTEPLSRLSLNFYISHLIRSFRFFKRLNKPLLWEASYRRGKRLICLRSYESRNSSPRDILYKIPTLAERYR